MLYSSNTFVLPMTDKVISIANEDTKKCNDFSNWWKEHRKNLPLFSSTSCSAIDWLNIFPEKRVKSFLYKNDELGTVGKDAIHMIGACAAVLVAELVHASIEIQKQTSIEVGVMNEKRENNSNQQYDINKVTLQAAINKIDTFDFLNGVLDEVPGQSKATILSMDNKKSSTRKRKAPPTKTKVAPMKKATNIIHSNNIVATDAISLPITKPSATSLIVEAVKVANLQPHYVDTNNEIVIDEDDYD